MPVVTDFAFDLESLAVDVFSLTDESVVVESLTGRDETVGPAMSCCSCVPYLPTCSCSEAPQFHGG